MSTEQQIQTAWDVKEAREFTKKVLPNGRYKCTLKAINQIDVPTNPKFWDEEKRGPRPATEKKLLFIFEPHDIEVSAGEECVITTLCTPSNSLKSNCYKLLCSMSKEGTIPEPVRVDAKLYQAFGEDMQGKVFFVMSQQSKSGKYNNAVAVIPSDEPVAQPVRAATQAQPAAALQTGFESLPDVGAMLHQYDISKLGGEQRKKAEAILIAAHAISNNDERTVFNSPTKLEKLAKFYVGEVMDDIPF